MLQARKQASAVPLYHCGLWQGERLHFVACIAIYGFLIATIRYSLLLSVHSDYVQAVCVTEVYTN